jgi:hypothetical protein
MGKMKTAGSSGESGLFSVVTDFDAAVPPAVTPKTPEAPPEELKSGFTSVTDFDT